jgi:hypothetical protein
MQRAQETRSNFYIKNTVNGKILLGSSLNLEGYLNAHKFMLMTRSHRNEQLQMEWKKFGSKNRSRSVRTGIIPIEKYGRNKVHSRQYYAELISAPCADYNFYILLGNGKNISYLLTDFVTDFFAYQRMTHTLLRLIITLFPVMNAIFITAGKSLPARVEHTKSYFLLPAERFCRSYYYIIFFITF